LFTYNFLSFYFLLQHIFSLFPGLMGQASVKDIRQADFMIMFLVVTSQNSLGMRVNFDDNGTPAARLFGVDLATPIVLLLVSGRASGWRARALVCSLLGPDIWWPTHSLGHIELNCVIKLLFLEPCLKLGQVSPFQPITALPIRKKTAPFRRSGRILGRGQSVAWLFITCAVVMCFTRISRAGNWAGSPNA
jgi:hypothetical protein